MPVIEALSAQSSVETTFSTDSGYHSKANVAALAARSIEAYIPDTGYRKRDSRYEGQERHRGERDPLGDKRKKPAKSKRFRTRDFRVAEVGSHVE